MKIIEVKQLPLPEVKVTRFARFPDDRGYFTEVYKQSDFWNGEQLSFLKNQPILQITESHSKKGVMRGLHTQWSPFMGKLIRTISGHMVDMVMDIRLGSPNFGKVVAHDMPSNSANNYGEWIWVPPGFAHGNFFFEETTIEYLCTGEYSPGNEVGISPLSADLDWSVCDTKLKAQFDEAVKQGPIISAKDQAGLTLTQWKNDPRSQNFKFGEL
jgi:dTDP-4-dehydrorhamnose 3,5-epimerase